MPEIMTEQPLISETAPVNPDTIDQPYARAEALDQRLHATGLGSAATAEQVDFAWLEVTGSCQEKCSHCYAESGPTGTHGTMTTERWETTIDELADMGIDMVQFIGGEPTLLPSLARLVEHTLGRGLKVEIYSNLVHLSPQLRELIKGNTDRLSLATSYYSPDPATHRSITGRNTLNPIRKNIQWAVASGVDLRIGLIGVQDGQDIDGAIAELTELGVDPEKIGVDYLRQVGRGVRDEVTSETTSQLCGNCANGVVAVLPDGRVQPCVFSRQSDFTVGNVHDQRLPEILQSDQMAAVRSLLRGVFQVRIEANGQPQGTCSPKCLPRTQCAPDKRPSCPPAITPCDPGNNPPGSPNCSPNCRPNKE